MKLERLETLNLISTKNVIVNEVLNGLDRKPYYNRFELEINLSLVLFTLLGNTELHKEMAREDINWIDFVNENYKLIEELKEGEFGDTYRTIFDEILRGAEKKAEYYKGIGSILDELKNVFTEENITKLQEALKETNKEVTE
jgi:hypothetical protein